MGSSVAESELGGHEDDMFNPAIEGGSREELEAEVPLDEVARQQLNIILGLPPCF